MNSLENHHMQYERTLQFMTFMALDRLYPDIPAKAEYSVGRGLYVTLSSHTVSAEELDRIEEEIRTLAKNNLPITTEKWNYEDAIAYFRSHHREDKAMLMEKAGGESVLLSRCGDYLDDLYGELFPSTGYASVFELISFFPGFVLQFPATRKPDEPSRVALMPKHLRAFTQSVEWCRLIGLRNITDFYSAMEEGNMRSYIRINEVLHDEEIGSLADSILHSGRKIVMVAGPSSSGKTTFAIRLGTHLMVRGKRFLRLSLDDYYRNKCDLTPGPDGQYDLECLEALDVPLIHEQLTALSKGETVDVPRFDFHIQRRREERVRTTLGESDILIVEGIHGLNPALIDSDMAYHVFITPLTCMNIDAHNRIHTRDIRLLRRMVRDQQFRNTTPEETLKMWSSVKAGEDKWIFACQEMADTVFNSALHYELPVLKKYSYAQLKKCDRSLPNVERLLSLLELVPDLSDELMDEIPPLSLLREFIGGCTAEKA